MHREKQDPGVGTLNTAVKIVYRTYVYCSLDDKDSTVIRRSYHSDSVNELYAFLNLKG
jgi:hypothetical protein